jgi:hypothetical protein
VFWASKELGLSHTASAKKLEMSLAGVGFSVEKEALIGKKVNIHLKEIIVF